jgi:hypothetical protein
LFPLWTSKTLSLRQSPSPQCDGSHFDDSLNLPLEKAHRSRFCGSLFIKPSLRSGSN